MLRANALGFCNHRRIAPRLDLGAKDMGNSPVALVVRAAEFERDNMLVDKAFSRRDRLKAYAACAAMLVMGFCALIAGEGLAAFNDGDVHSLASTRLLARYVRPRAMLLIVDWSTP